MSQSQNGTSSPEFQLPPVVEQAPVQAASAENLVPIAEQGAAPAAAEKAPAANAQGATVPAIPLPVPPAMPVTTAVQNDVSGTTNSTSSLTASDSDLIEKEWVNKAKQIVERTRDDPFRQSEQLTEVKVDYLKKRYGKTVKLK